MPDSSFEAGPLEKVLFGTKAQKYQSGHGEFQAKEKFAKILVFRKRQPAVVSAPVAAPVRLLRPMQPLPRTVCRARRREAGLPELRLRIRRQASACGPRSAIHQLLVREIISREGLSRPDVIGPEVRVVGEDLL